MTPIEEASEALDRIAPAVDKVLAECAEYRTSIARLTKQKSILIKALEEIRDYVPGSFESSIAKRAIERIN